MAGNYRGSLFSQPRPSAPPPPRRDWPGLLWNIFRRILMAFGGLFLLTMIMGIFISIAVLKGMPQQSLPGKFVLEMTLEDDYPEYQMVSSPLGGGGGPTMLQIVNALDHAGRDNRVKGLVVDLEDAGLGLGHIDELRAALVRFRKTGKPAYVYAPEYGEPGRGLGTYYLASAFSEIWMQPVGALSIAGISVEMPFARGALDKLGVQPQFFARKEYKSLFDSFNNHEMSPANREEMTTLLQDIGDHFITGIAQAKNMTPAAVRGLMDKGLFTDKEALAAGLVTTLDGYDGLKDKVSEDVTGKKDKTKAPPKSRKKKSADDLFVDMDRYVMDNKNDPGPGGKGPKKRVALVYITGAITAQPSQGTMPFGGGMPTGENIAQDLLAIADDPGIDTVVLRIDSPGGAPSAAETIRRAAVRCKENGKKIIVSMGDEAASGGYWIATAGDYIFALPGTLTGSIGVAGGKFVLTGLWNKLGINWQSIDLGATAGMWSFNRPFSPVAAARMNAMMDEVYDNFIGLVAKSRHMTTAQADAVARGRVWSGRQAKARGLVDELGGLDTALDYTAAQIGAHDRSRLNLEIFPRPQSALQKLEDLAGQVRGPGPINGALAPVAEQLDRAVKAGQYLTYQPLRVR